MAGVLVVVGLGYVGLPLAQEATRAGWTVRGLDVHRGLVDDLNRGLSHVDDLSDEDVVRMLAADFRATTHADVLEQADVVVVCVPTPLNSEGEPDLAAVRSAVSTIGPRLRPGILVVLESTTYPGTTEEVVKPMLETDDLKAGIDFHLAFSPERIDPGNQEFGLRNTPKVVGGVTPECTEAAARFYSSFVDEVVCAAGSREAEMAKLLENTYRHINIALVNEMAKFCHELEIDLWDVIRCAATKPFGFQAFYPGPGVGGHCIPIDPNYLSYRVKTQLGYPFRFVELAEEVNSSMPGYVTSRVQQILNTLRRPLNGSRVLLLGVTYKPDISDQRESPADPTVRLLREGGAEVIYHDPFVAEWSVDDSPVDRAEDLDSALSAADVTVLLQHHSSFDLQRIAGNGRVVLDTRGVIPRQPSVHRL